MIDSTIAAYLFSTLAAVLVIFQAALALGVPWGELAMGGKYPGRYPLKMRVAALVLLVLHIFIALVVLIRAGLVFEPYYDFSRSAIWFIVALFIVGTVLNAITPSKKEKVLWTPIAVVMLICSCVVAMS